MAIANFYLVTDDKRKLEKSLANVKKSDVGIIYKDATERIKPIIILDYDESLKDANYVYLTDKNSYYYIDGSPIIDGKRVILKLMQDARMTHKTLIRQQIATITRNEKVGTYNSYLPDNKYKVLTYETVTCKMFPNAMDNDSVILMTVG